MTEEHPEQQEDVKPKINLVVDFEGQTCTVKVKPGTPFKKLFEASEKRFGKDPGTFKFTFSGVRLRPEETPAEHNMEDGDTIDAHLQQNDAVQKLWAIPLQLVSCGFTGTVASGVARIVYGLGSTVQSLVHKAGSGRQVELVSGGRTIWRGPMYHPLCLCNLVTAGRSQ